MIKRDAPIIKVLETLVIIMILLVLIQTFLEDLSVYLGFSSQAIKNIKLTALFFDLFFTIEFIFRLIAAVGRKEGKIYFLNKNGWIDMLASVPLLLLVSGPYFLENVLGISFSSIAVFNTLGLVKVIRAIRVTRILRFLRVLKIFGKIKNVESVMAQRHISVISTIVIFSLILFLFITATFQQLGVIDSDISRIEKIEEDQNNTFTQLYFTLDKNKFIEAANSISLNNQSILAVEFMGEKIYYDASIEVKDANNIFKKNHTESKVIYDQILSGKLIVVYSRDKLLRAEALTNLINFFLILFVLLCLVIIYTRHFAQTVTDPIFVMRNGFEKKEYTLAVKIPDIYQNDDIFYLANDYNNRWLPAKMRKLNEMKSKTSLLSLDSVFKKK